MRPPEADPPSSSAVLGEDPPLLAGGVPESRCCDSVCATAIVPPTGSWRSVARWASKACCTVAVRRPEATDRLLGESTRMSPA